jgi:hypothetical protein
MIGIDYFPDFILLGIFAADFLGAFAELPPPDMPLILPSTNGVLRAILFTHFLWEALAGRGCKIMELLLRHLQQAFIFGVELARVMFRDSHGYLLVFGFGRHLN